MPGVIRDDDFLEIAFNLKRVVFTGTAGAGKSMLMKYLFLQLLSIHDDVLPLFVELRDLNEFTDKSIVEFVFDKIRERIESFSIDQLKYSLKEGIVVLFLDGYDEIDYDERPMRSREIISLSNSYEKLVILMSSRTDEVFRGWERFNVYQLSDLTKNQVKLLIEKIPYDGEVKELFARKMDSGLFESHKEFLVNPLLVIMMLVTLQQFAEIPAKIHLFYEYAFEALFARHDTTKSGGFKRKRYVKLALDDYRRLFSYFCAVSYLREIFGMSEAGALELLEKSIQASQIVTDKQSMLNDLVQCTCMLSRDGLEYVFSHRSFQEYFTAYFISRVKIEEFDKIAPKLAARGQSDSVLMMVSEMNKEKFEEVWVVPQLRRLWEAVQNIDPGKNPVSFLEALTERRQPDLLIRISPESKEKDTRFFWGFGGDPPGTTHEKCTLADARASIYRIYDVHGRIRKGVKNEGLDYKVLTEILIGELLPGDKRTDAIRKSNAIQSRRTFAFQIRTKRSDNRWLIRTDFVKQLIREKAELRQLLSEVEARVQARKDGIQSILGIIS
jgi:hypothetical protein